MNGTLGSLGLQELATIQESRAPSRYILSVAQNLAVTVVEGVNHWDNLRSLRQTLFSSSGTNDHSLSTLMTGRQY
jgi:hypothetical protein